MRTTSPRKQSTIGTNTERTSPEQGSDDGCIYCLPPAPDAPPETPTRPGHECMIKRLGSWERRQVSLALHRAGFDEHLFTCGCPASRTHAFRDCPFYENASDLDTDPGLRSGNP
jgi:hypothetical protein